MGSPARPAQSAVVAKVSRREIKPERRPDLDQHREVQGQAALDHDRLPAEKSGEHGGLIVGFAPAATLLEATRLAFEGLDPLFNRGELIGARGLEFQICISFAERPLGLIEDVLAFLRPAPLVILLKAAQGLLHDRLGARRAKRLTSRLSLLDVAPNLDKPRRDEAPILHHAAITTGLWLSWSKPRLYIHLTVASYI